MDRFYQRDFQSFVFQPTCDFSNTYFSANEQLRFVTSRQLIQPSSLFFTFISPPKQDICQLHNQQVIHKIGLCRTNVTVKAFGL